VNLLLFSFVFVKFVSCKILWQCYSQIPGTGWYCNGSPENAGLDIVRWKCRAAIWCTGNARYSSKDIGRLHFLT